MRLSGIFDDEKSVGACKFQNRVHVRRLPEKVNRNNRFGSLGQTLLKFRGVHRECVWIHIHKYRASFAVSNRLGGGDKCVRNRNDFIAFTNSKRQESKPKGVGAIAHGDCVGGPTECSELFFELFHERSAGKGAALDHFANSSIEFFNERGVMRLQIEEGTFIYGLGEIGMSLEGLWSKLRALRVCVSAKLARSTYPANAST